MSELTDLQAHTRPGRAISPCVSVALQLYSVLPCIRTSFMLRRFDKLHMLKQLQLTVWLLQGYASSYLACCSLDLC